MALIMSYANEYTTTDALENVVNYILDSIYLDSYGGYGVMLTSNLSIINNFTIIQKAFFKDNGVRVHHLCISFERNSILPTDIYYIAEEVSKYIGQEFQNIYGIHSRSDDNDDHIHIHLAINSVSYVSGHKFNYNYSYLTPLVRQLEEDYEICFKIH